MFDFFIMHQANMYLQAMIVTNWPIQKNQASKQAIHFAPFASHTNSHSASKLNEGSQVWHCQNPSHKVSSEGPHNLNAEWNMNCRVVQLGHIHQCKSKNLACHCSGFSSLTCASLSLFFFLFFASWARCFFANFSSSVSGGRHFLHISNMQGL